MSDIVSALINDMQSSGWSANREGSQLKFTRGETVILATQETVQLVYESLHLCVAADRMWTTMHRLEWLLSQIREHAALVDSGQVVVMDHWQKAENTLRKLSWDKVLSCPEALALIEQGIALLGKGEAK